ncbi:hypothetical protein ACFY0G_17500 [Streptomyces sp. NPDC001552]|uniref:hypothetical protein n=1 Tax=Streptomyces sp. NPDC001552 TaxID=3364587 RepID=UPI0036B7AB9F
MNIPQTKTTVSQTIRRILHDDPDIPAVLLVAGVRELHGDWLSLPDTVRRIRQRIEKQAATS